MKSAQRHSSKPKHKQLRSVQIAYIREKIQDEWSPEQISGTMASAGISTVSHETIYRYLQKDRSEGGRLYTYLRHKSRKYRRRYGSSDKRGQIRNRVSIEQRPKIVDTRSRIGDFEIDTVIGKNHK